MRLLQMMYRTHYVNYNGASDSLRKSLQFNGSNIEANMARKPSNISFQDAIVNHCDRKIRKFCGPSLSS